MYLKSLFRESHNSFPSDDAVSRTKFRPAPESLSPVSLSFPIMAVFVFVTPHLPTDSRFIELF